MRNTDFEVISPISLVKSTLSLIGVPMLIVAVVAVISRQVNYLGLAAIHVTPGEDAVVF